MVPAQQMQLSIDMVQRFVRALAQERIVKLFVMVNCTADFKEPQTVANAYAAHCPAVDLSLRGTYACVEHLSLS